MNSQTPPTTIKTLHHVVSDLIPDKQQQQHFLVRLRKHITTVLLLACKARSTLSGAAIGWLIGEMIDTIPVIGYLTQGNASIVGAFIGGLNGLPSDLDRHFMERGIRHAVIKTCKDMETPHLIEPMLKHIGTSAPPP